MRPPALVLAAGNGARLAATGGGPKPLTPVAGRPLLDHLVGALTEVGVERVHIVTGYEAAALRDHAFEVEPIDGVDFCHNPRYSEPNGLSLLAAEELIEEPFLLLMADHLFEAGMLEAVLDAGASGPDSLLAVDRKVDQVFDPEDATRVATRDGVLLEIGKGLQDFDAVDTGLFLLSPAVFGAMRESVANGDASLSGGIRVLARRGEMRVFDVGSAAWIDVDTPEALAEAERLVHAGRVGQVPTPAGGER